MARAIARFIPGALLVLSAPVAAQMLPPSQDTESAAPVVTDPLGRETPRGTVNGLLRALAQRDYERAGQYLKPSEQEIAAGLAAREAEARALEEAATQAAEGRAIPEPESDPERFAGGDAAIAPPADTELPVELSERAQLARTLQALLDRAGKLTEFTGLSNRSEGAVNDGYPANLERVGTLRGAEEIPILLSRDPDEETGLPVWRVSRQTIADFGRVVPPEAQDELVQAVETAVDEPAILGAPLRDWTTLLSVAFVTFFLAYAIGKLVLMLLQSMLGNERRSRIFRAANTILPPLLLLVAVAAFQITTNAMQVSIVAQQSLLRYNGILGWVAVLWFGIRLVGTVARAAVIRLEQRQTPQSKSAISLIERTVKLLILAFGAFVILDALGFDVTTGIAALGIGGLAFALGAQKTVENLVGSVTVIADKPVRIGDFCRVGDVIGAVEDIGIRSTRIRTIERTLVTIPNADFSSQRIENYSERDRFLFAPVLGLPYHTDAAGIREAIAIIEAVLGEHDRVDHAATRVLLNLFGASSLDIKVFTYILVPDFNESEVIRHALLLAIHERLGAAGHALAFPTTTVQLVPASEDGAAAR